MTGSARDYMSDADIDDVVFPFQIANTAVRGQLARLGPVVDEILSRHAYATPVSMLAGEAVTLAAMLGASLKHDGKLTLQVQSGGAVSMLVADATAAGALRACAKADADAVAADTPLLSSDGHLALTLDQGEDMDRYQGVVPLEGETLTAAALAYFDQSEQIPTAIKLAVGRSYVKGGAEVWRAGGVMVQFVPSEGGVRERGEAIKLDSDAQDAWTRAAALLETTEPEELLDPTLAPGRLLYRLYHEDGVRMFEPKPLHFDCSCNRDKITSVLSRYPRTELEAMARQGVIDVTCDFCGEAYRFSVDEAAASA